MNHSGLTESVNIANTQKLKEEADQKELEKLEKEKIRMLEFKKEALETIRVATE